MLGAPRTPGGNRDAALAFRFAHPGDVPAIVGLVDSACRGEASRAGWTTEADLLDGQRADAGAISAVLARPGSGMLLAGAGAGASWPRPSAWPVTNGTRAPWC